MEIKLTKILKALSDQNRLRILHILSKHHLCVCEIESVLKLNQSNVSRHLGKLKDVGLIEYRKEGIYIRHFLSPEMMEEYPFILTLIDQLPALSPFDIDSANIQHGIECACKK